MAETPSITPLTNINGIVSAAVTTINNNFTAITAALDDVLSRSGVTPNQMETAIDMNGNTLLNLPSPANPTDPVRLEDVTAMQGGGSVTINNTIQGTNAVTSIAAVQALASPATVKTTILAAPGLTGVFNWSASNLSTQVTNDPAHAIYIPPTTDTTGASGAWVRQYSGPADFGWFGLTSGALVSGATATANSTALVNWSKWARYESSLGFGVDMYVEPGTYPWDMALTQHWTANTQLLRITGYGSTWQNISANSSWFAQWPIDWPGFLTAATRFLINSTVVGSKAITTITHTDIANLVVGDYVMLTSLDIQYFGYPPNASNFEYPAITSVNQYAATSPSVVAYNNGLGTLTLTFPSALVVPITLAAASSFTTGSQSITMSSNPGTILPGFNVYDATNSQQIGTVSSFQGTLLDLALNASHASSGSTDSLLFTPPITGALVTMGGMTATGGTPPNGTWPISSVSGDGTVVVLQTTIGLGTLVFTANGTLAAVGVATLDRPIRCQHMSTYPDNPGTTVPAGAARVWLLKNNGGAGSILWDWNTKHIFEGIRVLKASNQPGQGYLTSTGKYVEWRYCDIPGISPSVIGTAKYVGNKFSGVSDNQPDKLIDVCILEGNEVPGTLQFSVSTNVLVATGNTISGIFAPGAKSNILNGNNIGTLTPGSAIGVTRSCILNGGTVDTLNLVDHFGSGIQFVVGSGGITYASGTFTFPWANVGVAAVPGMIMHFALAGGLYAYDLGTMMVTGIRGDATNLYVDTTCQSASVPSFSTGQVFVRRLQRFIANGVSGCDEIRRISAQCARGFEEWEYLEEQIIGSGTAAGTEKSVGIPINFDINVRQVCAVSSKTLTLNLTMFPTATPSGSAEHLILTLDLSTLGKRKINQTTGASVLLGADTLTFNGSSATAFPTGWFLDGNGRVSWTLNYTPSALTSVQLPWIEMKLQFDPGMFFTAPTAQLDQSLLSTFIGAQGAIN